MSDDDDDDDDGPDDFESALDERKNDVGGRKNIVDSETISLQTPVSDACENHRETRGRI